MDHLLRELAPLTSAAWGEVEDEATRTLRHFLAGRKLVDFHEEGGWDSAALSDGRLASVTELAGGVTVATRAAIPYNELRVDFAVSRAEANAVDRGAQDMDTQSVIDAARSAALAEDQAVLHGLAEIGAAGVLAATPHDVIPLADDVSNFALAVTDAVEVLRDAGVAGPYGIGMGPRCWTGVLQATERGGYPLLKHLKMIVDGPVVWAPSIAGAVVLSQRGDDYEVIAGQDWSIGYESHDDEVVRLYLTESIATRVNTPEAAVALSFAD